MWGGAEERVNADEGQDTMAFRSSFRTAKRPHNACKRVRKQRPDGLHCTRRGACVGADPVTGPDVRHRTRQEGTTTMRKRTPTALAIAGVLVLAACGSDDNDAADTIPAATEAPATDDD